MIPISYNLYIENDCFLIFPNSSIQECIYIDRLSEEVTYQANNKRQPSGHLHKIVGIWGMINIISGHFLIVIKSAKLMGVLNGHEIYQITESQIIPLSRSNRHINDAQIMLEKEYIQMLEQVLKSENFYFSPSGDLTHSFSRLANVSQDFYQNSLFERADERFVWNHSLLSNFISDSDLQKFALPVMHGFIGAIRNQISRSTPQFEVWLISRRSVLRAGTRYYSRGSDVMGNVSNYVETEQILLTDKHIMAFVQTRGSIPLLWHQKPNMYYKPKPILMQSDGDQLRVLKEHFNSQIYSYKYGTQIVVNLLNQSGSEKPLGSLYSRIIREANMQSIKYLPFDFHHVCRNMRWDKLSVLMDDLNPLLKSIGYTHRIKSNNSNPTLFSKRHQTGVVRTNCIDCLDRTNVVQSIIAWRVLAGMMKELGIITGTTDNNDSKNAALDVDNMLKQLSPELNYQYKNMWADNGDSLAAQYTGTGALKSDYTRTGKRSSSGLIQDGYKSAVRYVLNNFRDGFRQDSLDLLLGNYVVDSLEGSSANRISPLQKSRTAKYKIVPWILVIALSMIILRILFPLDDFGKNVIHVLFFIFLLILCVSIIFKNGYEFVDSPRLKRDD